MSKQLDFEISEEAAIIAADLIQEHHLHLKDEQDDIPLVCLARTKQYSGRPAYAKARMVRGGLIAFLAQEFLKSKRKGTDEEDEAIGAFRIIEIVKPLWQNLKFEQKRALIDHELCHFAPEGKMRRHDLEEFRSVVERHGFYLPDVKEFADSIKKMSAEKKEDTNA